MKAKEIIQSAKTNGKTNLSRMDHGLCQILFDGKMKDRIMSTHLGVYDKASEPEAKAMVGKVMMFTWIKEFLTGLTEWPGDYADIFKHVCGQLCTIGIPHSRSAAEYADEVESGFREVRTREEETRTRRAQDSNIFGR